MKVKNFFLAVACGFCITQVQTAQAMKKSWLIGTGVAVTTGVVVYVARKPIGKASLYLSRGYQEDHKKMVIESSDDMEEMVFDNYGQLKDKIEKNYAGSSYFALRSYMRRLISSQILLSPVWLLNCKNQVGKKISDRMKQMEHIELTILRDPNYYEKS